MADSEGKPSTEEVIALRETLKEKITAGGGKYDEQRRDLE
jgi:hypothetical protein